MSIWVTRRRYAVLVVRGEVNAYSLASVAVCLGVWGENPSAGWNGLEQRIRMHENVRYVK
ncbi:MAG: hypothetical protein H0U46_03900 [Actinobacteria bacterium]|nr:hypothetical protein [Actinomycetota bacterium]